VVSGERSEDADRLATTIDPRAARSAISSFLVFILIEEIAAGLCHPSVRLDWEQAADQAPTGRARPVAFSLVAAYGWSNYGAQLAARLAL
jgi:hypothetical protein